MKSGPFFFKFDKSGFPMIGIGELYISLFPVSKYQTERLRISEGSKKKKRFGKKWLKEAFDINPAVSWKDWGETPWRLFLTGLMPEEIKSFIALFGPGFRLPTPEEWKALLELEVEIASAKDEILASMKEAKVPAPVLLWIEHGLFPLTGEGLIEIVEEKGVCRAMGRPWHSFMPNTWKPFQVREVYRDRERMGFVGFRTVCEVYHLV